MPPITSDIPTKTLAGLVAMLAVLNLSSSHGVGAQPGPLPTVSDVLLKNVSGGGSGCPPGSYSVLVTSSIPGGPADFFEVVYDKLSVEKGPGLPSSSSRRACTLALDLVVPKGFRFALVDVHYEGFADIPAGESGILKTEYHFPNLTETSSAVRTLPGSFRGDYAHDDTVSSFTRKSSPCKQNIPIKIRSSLELEGPQDSSALMTIDQQTGLMTQRLAIQWEGCNS